jgi:hypothetical protein
LPPRAPALNSKASARSSGSSTVFTRQTSISSTSTIGIENLSIWEGNGAQKSLPQVPGSQSIDETAEASQSSHGVPTMKPESRRIWEIIESSLPFWTRKDAQRWGKPSLCDIFSVLVPPRGRDNGSTTTSKGDKFFKLQMFSYCVLFPTKLAFFLPRYHYHERPNENSKFTLAGIIDVQRDVHNPQLRPIVDEHAIGNRRVLNKLEFFATYGDSSSRYFEQIVWFVSVRTHWSVDDKTREWETMLRALLRSPCERRSPGDRRSFLLSQVAPIYHHQLTEGYSRNRGDIHEGRRDPIANVSNSIADRGSLPEPTIEVSRKDALEIQCSHRKVSFSNIISK